MNGVIYSLAVKQMEIFELTFLQNYSISIRKSIYTSLIFSALALTYQKCG